LLLLAVCFVVLAVVYGLNRAPAFAALLRRQSPSGAAK
jgi:hypothetical protein